MNNRNHRKIIIIDGQIGYVGGFNVGDDYLGLGKLGYWRDTHTRVQGRHRCTTIKIYFRLEFTVASSTI